MVVYSITWFLDKDLTTKARKGDNIVLYLSVLCRNSADALYCFRWWFANVANNKFDIDDGEIQMKRSKIDSRGFDVSYLYADGIKEPIYLHDLKSNLVRANKIFISLR